MNIFSFLLYFWKEKNYLIYCINKITNYIVSWLFTKKKHHARYVCQSVLYNGESRNSNYDDFGSKDHGLGTEVDRGRGVHQ